MADASERPPQPKEFDPAEFLPELTSNAAKMRAAADAMTARIAAFEAWIAKLPGKIDCDVYVCSDQEGDVSTILELSRAGRDWHLYLFEYDFRDETRESRRLLRDASIVDKIVAIRAFPKLLNRMSERHIELAKNAADASSTFDQMASRLGIKEGA